MQSFEPDLVSWMNLDANKQLRLVGGNQHSPRTGFAKPNAQFTMVALRQRMTTKFGASRVSLIPETAGFFREAMYIQAVAAPAHAGIGNPDAFDMSSEHAQGTPSKETGVFIDAYPTSTSALKVEGRNASSAPKPANQRDVAVVPCNSLELAGFMRVKYINSDGRKPLYQDTSGPRMRHDVALSIASMTEDARHQWAACGGDGDALRNAAFVGHLHDCLKKGGL